MTILRDKEKVVPAPRGDVAIKTTVDEETKTAAQAIVTITSEQAAHWQMTSNAIHKGARPQDLRYAVLVQFGPFTTVSGDTIDPKTRVTVHWGAEQKQFLPHEIEASGKTFWLDAVAGNSDGLKDPVKPEDFPLLFPADLHGAGQLHQSRQAYRGGMSIWQDRTTDLDKDLTIWAKQVALNYQNRYIFRYDKPLQRVHVYEFTGEVPSTPTWTMENVHAIDVVEKGGGGDDDPLNPPQRPRGNG